MITSKCTVTETAHWVCSNNRVELRIASHSLKVLVLLFAAPAIAQSGTLVDGFESTGLLKADGGQWDLMWIRPNVGLGVSTAAAHSGDGGLRLVDMAMTPVSEGDQGYLEATVSDAGPSFWAQLWVRPVSSTGVPGFITLFDLTQATGLSTVAAYIDFTDFTIGAGGFDSLGRYQYLQTATSAFVLGQWYRIEVVARGIGSPNGIRELWLDRRLVDRQSVDLSGRFINRVFVGAPWSDVAWTGVIDFDDLEVSSNVPPELDAGPFDAGSTDGGVDSGVQDAGLDAGAVDAGAHDGGVDAGALDAGTEGETDDAGTPDAGANVEPKDDGRVVPTHFLIGCGCGASGDMASFTIILLLVRVVRRRRDTSMSS